MKLSVVIPAHNEAEVIEETLVGVATTLTTAEVPFEVVVVDDASQDGTADVVAKVAERWPEIRCVRSEYPGGFGYAVRFGLDVYEGDAVSVVMADASDDPADLVKYYRLLEAGYDCAFGSRFMRGGRTIGYPRVKLVVNRIVNAFIQVLFGHGYNDTTNAFKAYRREVIDAVQPLVSPHFNLTVEIPLKAVIRGYSYAITPISWRDRSAGVSKLKLQEQGSRYLFIVLMTFFEHHLSRGDYRRGQVDRGRWRAGRPAARIDHVPVPTR
ncbi:MAG: glycosyltransferase family 2 protein, partial [Patulibacter minatonensis]